MDMRNFTFYCTALLASCTILNAQAPAQPPTRFDKLEVPGTFAPKIYTDVSVLGWSDGKLKFSHSGGITSVPLNMLPEAIRSKFPPPAAAMPATAPVPVAPAAAGVTPGTAPLPKDCTAATVLIEGQGKGTGFLVAMGGTHYLYTAVHVLADEGKLAFKLVDGTQISISDATKVEVSDEEGAEDVVRIALTQVPKASLVISDEGSLSAEIEAYGNSSGEGVVTNSKGAITGVGTKEIEIDAGVVPGNSGGPIVLAGTNKVVGMVTRASAARQDIWTKNTTSAEVRRFGIRPAKVGKWAHTTLGGIQAQARRLKSLRLDTRTVAAVLFLEYFRDGITTPSTKQGDYVIREVIREGSSTNAGKSISGAIAQANAVLQRGRGTMLSPVTVKKTYTDFFTSVHAASKDGVANVDPTIFVRFLRPDFKAEADLRKEIVTELNKLWETVISARVVR